MIISNSAEAGDPGEDHLSTNSSEAVPSGISSTAPASGDGTSKRSAVKWALWALLAYLAFDLILPLVPYHPQQVHTPLQLAFRRLVFWLPPTVLFMLLQIWLARNLVALRWRPATAVSILVGSIALWVGMLIVERNVVRFGAVAAHFVLADASIVYGLLITVGLTAAGTLLARIIRAPNILLPVALVAMPIDYVGAMTSVGFTNTVVQRAPDVVSKVSVHIPHASGLPVVAMIGPGDVLFIAFFFSVVQHFEMNERGTFWWMFGLLTLAMAEVLLIGLPIAALVPMGIAILIANWPYFRLKRDEVFALLYAALIVFAVVGVFYVYAHRMLTHGH